jgi:phosphinothricin acetyltransferase
MVTNRDSAFAKQSVAPKTNRPESTESGAFHVRQLTDEDRETLLQMYRNFYPLGGAQGLPPRTEEARRGWIDRALGQEINIGAFLVDGELTGHSFLASSEAGESELAVFVHQRARHMGVGTAMVKAIVEQAERRGLRRICALTSSDNVSKLRLLARCGFRSSESTYDAEIFVLDL